VTDIEGWKVALTHGDLCKRTHTHPYFGISQAVAKEQQSRRRTDKDFDYMFMGHWHHLGIIEDGIIICPSLIGPNQFSQYRMHARSQARQLLTFWTKKHGLSTMWPINL
jgi:predicted phosphodiesterase